jgi:hypothetical protein
MSQQRPIDLAVDSPALEPPGQQQQAADDDRRFGGRDAGEEQRDHDGGRQQAADHQRALDVKIRAPRGQHGAGGELVAVEQRNQTPSNDQSRQRNRAQGQEERVVRKVGEAADHDVLRMPVMVAVDPTFDAIATARR